jgi:hypothetical protein
MASLQQLEQRHPKWIAYYPHWMTLQELRLGFPAIKERLEFYLPQKPGEDLKIYQDRLDKASYTPILSTAIREFTAKLTSAPIEREGFDDDRWGRLLANLDNDRSDEPALLGHLFSTLLYFGSVWVMVDSPPVANMPRSFAEERNLPYLTVFEPSHVTNWGDGWAITRQQQTVSAPLSEPMTEVVWKVWTATQIDTYRANVKLGKSGSIKQVLSGGSWVMVPAVSLEATSTPNPIGRLPFAHVELSPEMCLGIQAYPKQLQHIRIENQWTDAGTAAGTVQRLYTPSPPPPMDDPRVAYQPQQNPAVGNQYVLTGADYKFVESSGAAIATLTSQLETIANDIRSIASMGYLSQQNKGALQQSGVSKEIDQSLLKDSLQGFGKIVLRLYQDCINLLADRMGAQDAHVVTGLDNYETDSLSAMLVQHAMLPAGLPPTAYRLWVGKVANALIGTAPQSIKDLVATELEQVTQDDTTEPTDTDRPTG